MTFNVFGMNISMLCDSRLLSQGDLANSSGVSRQTINCLLKVTPEKPPSIKYKNALEIAKALNVDFPSLFCELKDEQLSELNEYHEDDFLDIYRQNVKRELIRSGRKQKELSVEGWVQESTISEILSGISSNPSLTSLIYISSTLNVKIEKLFRRGG